MSIIYCSCCSEKIGQGEIRWAEEEAYCDDCFCELFTHCDHCDDVVRRSNAYFDDLGNAHCSNCWDEENDDECPDNPHVDDADRKLIVELSRSWLLGKHAKRCVLKINQKDYLLSRIKERVGLVDQSIYLFGLQDREEYQLSASSNLVDQVKEFILLNGLDWKVTEGIGCNRIGISYSLRQNHLSPLIKLINRISRLSVKQFAA